MGKQEDCSEINIDGKKFGVVVTLKIRTGNNQVF